MGLLFTGFYIQEFLFLFFCFLFLFVFCFLFVITIRLEILNKEFPLEI